MVLSTKLVLNPEKYFLLKNLMKVSSQVVRELKEGHVTKNCEQTLSAQWLLTESRQETRDFISPALNTDFTKSLGCSAQRSV